MHGMPPATDGRLREIGESKNAESIIHGNHHVAQACELAIVGIATADQEGATMDPDQNRLEIRATVYRRPDV